MNRLSIAVALSLTVHSSCSGLPTTEVAASAPTALPGSIVPATSVVPTGSEPASPAAPVPAATLPVSVPTTGAVGPLLHGTPPCFADRYPCAAYDFSLPQPGAIEVTLTWEGAPRALLVQLYWAGEGLAHEAVAPRDGPSRIWFRRPLMEAAHYRLRVVSLEPEATIPFTLTLTR